MPVFAENCIAKFREMNPEYEIFVHDEKILADQFRPIYERLDNLCSKSDLLRLSALMKHGGWYFDADYYPIRPVSSIAENYDVEGKVFLTQQTSVRSIKAIANGIIGISKESPAWRTILGELRALQTSQLKRTTFGPILTTRVVNKIPDQCTIGKVKDFYPYSVNEKWAARAKYRELIRAGGYSPVSMEGNPYCIHLWAGGKDRIHSPTALKLPGKKTAVVIANNRKKQMDLCCPINSADLVMRINRCVGFGDEQKRMGYKTDILGLVSSGVSTKPFLKPLPFLIPGGRVRRQIGEIWFARPEGWVDGSRKEVGGDIVEAQNLGNVVRRYPSAECWERLEKKLREKQTEYVVPSTGMILIEMLLDDPRFKSYTKYLAGFSHQGWDSHPFDAEKAVVQAYVDAGMLHRVEDLT